jgi:hypothetical protein
MALHHFIVVRRDLPVGVIFSAITHAAGESFYALACPPVTFSTRTMASGAMAGPRMVTTGVGESILGPSSSVPEHQTFSLEVDGSIPSSGSFQPHETIAVVLGARNEGRLLRLERRLTDHAVRFVAIRETDGEYAGQLLAIGLLPNDRSRVASHVNEFHMFTELGS